MSARFTFASRDVLHDLQQVDTSVWAQLWAIVGMAEAAHDLGDDDRAILYLDQAADLEYDLTGDCVATDAAAKEIGRELSDD